MEKRFLKLNKDKFVKQILTHPHSTSYLLVDNLPAKHPKMSYNIMNIKVYKSFIYCLFPN